MTEYWTHFDRFHELVWIREHGEIQIYRGIQAYRRAEVLLKIVPRPAYGSDPRGAIEAFKRLTLEAVATDRVVHPNVVRVVDAGIGPDFASFLALELLKGCDLADELADKGPMDIPDALEMAIGVARGLCAAHAASVVHGDVKPSNIFLLDDGGVKLVDFGRAFAPDTAYLREPGRALGTPGYMCPRYAATGIADERSDVYSLGATLYEALSGVSAVTSLRRFRISEPSLSLRIDAPRPTTLLHELVPGVSRDLSNEIHRAMAADPEDRHPSMAVFLEAIERESSKARARRARRSDGVVATDTDPTVPYGLPAAVRMGEGSREKGANTAPSLAFATRAADGRNSGISESEPRLAAVVRDCARGDDATVPGIVVDRVGPNADVSRSSAGASSAADGRHGRSKPVASVHYHVEEQTCGKASRSDETVYGIQARPRVGWPPPSSVIVSRPTSTTVRSGWGAFEGVVRSAFGRLYVLVRAGLCAITRRCDPRQTRGRRSRAEPRAVAARRAR